VIGIIILLSIISRTFNVLIAFDRFQNDVRNSTSPKAAPLRQAAIDHEWSSVHIVVVLENS
jgi:hypothetical protein